jgi:DNA-binding transcriptional LysR family regulator
LVPVLRHWRSRRPDVVLELSEFTSADAMVATLAAGATDLAVGPRPTQTDAHVQVFGQEEMVVVAAAGHRFAGMSAVPMSALADEMFVHYDPTNGMASWVDQLAARHAGVLNPVCGPAVPDGSTTRCRRDGSDHRAGVGPGPAADGVVRRLRPMIRRDVIGIVAAHRTLWCGVSGRPDASWVTQLAGTQPGQLKSQPGLGRCRLSGRQRVDVGHFQHDGAVPVAADVRGRRRWGR